MNLFRVYEEHECGSDGYPHPWHRLSYSDRQNLLTAGVGIPTDYMAGLKDIVREQAGNRCVRCGHPYAKGDGEWSPCDERCTHAGPARFLTPGGWIEVAQKNGGDNPPSYMDVEAQWRVLTVHHLNEVKADCRWWNLAALDQRCHLTIQGKVKMDRPYDRPHSPWFIPYVCGFYASKYLDEDLTREEALNRQEELLMLELTQERLPGLTL